MQQFGGRLGAKLRPCGPNPKGRIMPPCWRRTGNPRCFVWCRLPQATDSALSRGPVGGRSPRPEACHVPFLRRRPSGTPTDRIYKKCIMPGLNFESCSEEPGVRSFSRESSAERSGKAPPAPLEGSTDPSALPSIHRGIRPTAQSGIQPEYRSEFSLTKSTPGRRAVRVRCCQFRQAPPLRRPAGPTRP